MLNSVKQDTSAAGSYALPFVAHGTVAVTIVGGERRRAHAARTANSHCVPLVYSEGLLSFRF